MSQENVEVVRANFEAWNAADMDTWRGLLDQDVIMRNPEGWPEPGPQVGCEAVVHFTEQLRDTGTPTPWKWSATTLTPPTELW